MQDRAAEPDPAQAEPQAAASRRRAVWMVPVGAVVVAVVAWLAFGRSTATPAPTVQQQVAAAVKPAVEKAMKDAAAAPTVSQQIYRAIAPSMVFIRTDDPADAVGAGTAPDSSPPSAPESTGPGGSVAPGDGDEGGLGSGVVINADGSILTANHVVDGATTIQVTFADGTSSSAQIVSQEPDNDIAVLKADQLPEVVVPAVMGGGVQVGDLAFAVGHPLGLVGSMSAGVISGLGRSIPVAEGKRLDGLIQFDAAVNPGSSGGPLLNRSGQVVGIVTALANPSEQGFFVGIGFAVPIGTAAGGGGGGGPQQ